MNIEEIARLSKFTPRNIMVASMGTQQNIEATDKTNELIEKEFFTPRNIMMASVGGQLIK